MDLYPFQKIGALRLSASTRLYLADEMGLGKTVQAVVAALMTGVQRVAVCCPARAKGVWERHFRELAPNITVTIRSYQYMVYHEVDPREWVAHLKPELVILDEAHFLKNPEAKRTRLFWRIANACPAVWPLSGTPMPNWPHELYAPLRAVWPDVLREHSVLRYADFYKRFTRDVFVEGQGYKTVGGQNLDELRSILDRVMLRRTWDQVGAQLPPLRWEITPMEGVTWTPKTEEERELLEEAWAAVEKGAEGSTHFATLRRLLGTAKAPEAANMLAEELAEEQYEKVVVMAYHHDTMDLLEKKLRRFGVVRLDGKTRDSAAIERRFQQDPKTRVFIGQLTAAGTAISLDAAHEVVLVEQMWSPDDNKQAVYRIRRITQKHPCRARMLVVPDSIDEAVIRQNLRKIQTKDSLALN